jgi:hypothetical protein
MPRNVTRTSRTTRISGTNDHRFGPARLLALILGIAYLGVALGEAILSQFGDRLVVGGATVLEFALTHNLVHWATGLLLVAAVFVTEPAARRILLLIGFAFAAVTLLGIFAPSWTGQLMGHGGMPWVYNLVHAVTAAGALVAGFMHTTRVAPSRHSRYPRSV